MVEISLYGSGEGPGWVTAPGYSTAGFPASDKDNSVKPPRTRSVPSGFHRMLVAEPPTAAVRMAKMDMAEAYNMAGEQPERTAAMGKKLERWLQVTGAIIPKRR